MQAAYFCELSLFSLQIERVWDSARPKAEARQTPRMAFGARSNLKRDISQSSQIHSINCVKSAAGRPDKEDNSC